MHGFDVGGVTTLSGSDQGGRELKKRTKELMTSEINAALQRRQLILPIEDTEVADQFTTQTYSLHNGQIVYSKGNDHIVDAARCGIRAWNFAKDEGGGMIGRNGGFCAPVMTAAVFV